MVNMGIVSSWAYICELFIFNVSYLLIAFYLLWLAGLRQDKFNTESGPIKTALTSDKVAEIKEDLL